MLIGKDRVRLYRRCLDITLVLSPSESSFMFYDHFSDLSGLVYGGNLVYVGVLMYAIQVLGHQGHLGMYFDELCGK